MLMPTHVKGAPHVRDASDEHRHGVIEFLASGDRVVVVGAEHPPHLCKQD